MVRTGDRAVDEALARIELSADVLRGRTGELAEHERFSLEQVTGDYLPILLTAYLSLPPAHREAEMSSGGTPRDALRSSLECMSALLVNAENRLNGVSATILAVGRARLEQQVKDAAARSDTPVVVLTPPEPRPSWPRWVALGVAGFVAFLVVATGAVVAVRAAVAALSPDPSGPTGGGIGMITVFAVFAAVLVLLSPKGNRNR